MTGARGDALMVDALFWPMLLLLIGLAFVVMEVFVPSGGVITVLAILAVLASIVVAFFNGTGAGVIMMCTTLAVVPAVCDELFFRGLLLQSLRRSHSAWVAVLISGLAFGLFHFLVESSVAPLRFLVTAAMGMILGWVCLRTGSVVPAILLHAVNNAILTSLALSRDQWQETPPSTGLVVGVLITCTLAGAVGLWLLRHSRRTAPLPTTTAWLMWGWVAASGAGVWSTELGASPAQGTDASLPRVAAGWQIRQLAGADVVRRCLPAQAADDLLDAGGC